MNYLTALKYIAPILAALLIALFIFRMGESSANAKWQSKWNKFQTEIASEKIKQLEAARIKDAQTQTEIDQAANNANTQVNIARNDADSVRSANARLQQQIKRYEAERSHKQGDTGASTTSATEAADGTLYANMLQRLGEAAGQLAGIADENRIAGLACEASYAAINTR